MLFMQNKKKKVKGCSRFFSILKLKMTNWYKAKRKKKFYVSKLVCDRLEDLTLKAFFFFFFFF